MIDLSDLGDDVLLMQPELEIGTLISTLLEKYDIETLSDKCEISASRLISILKLDGNPNLGEIKRLALVAGKRAELSFL